MGDPSHQAILDVEVGERGLPELIPRERRAARQRGAAHHPDPLHGQADALQAQREDDVLQGRRAHAHGRTAARRRVQHPRARIRPGARLASRSSSTTTGRWHVTHQSARRRRQPHARAARTGDGSIDRRRELIEDLAALERGAGSPGEEVAAHRLRERFERAGCTRAGRRGGVPTTATRALHAALSAVGVLGGPGRARRQGARRSPRSPGPERPSRSPTTARTGAASRGGRSSERRTTWNVVAETGDPRPTHTLVADGPPRRGADRVHLRRQRPADANDLAPGRDRGDRHRAADVVAGDRRARAVGARRADRPPRARARAGSSCPPAPRRRSPTSRGTGSCPARTTT